MNDFSEVNRNHALEQAIGTPYATAGCSIVKMLAERFCLACNAHMRTMAIMGKRKPLNLNLEIELIEKIKIQAVKENRTVSEIVTRLFREYLRKAKAKKQTAWGGPGTG